MTTTAAAPYTVRAGCVSYGRHAAFVPALSAALRLAASLPEWARVSVSVWRDGRKVYPVASATTTQDDGGFGR